MHLINIALLLAPTLVACWEGYPAVCPTPTKNASSTIGYCPDDFTIIGGTLEPVHESSAAPTGLALDNDKNIHLTYPRNAVNPNNTVVLCTSYTDEIAWPSAEIQRCAAGQNASTCFINVQNVVLDNKNVMWAVDSGIAYGATAPTPGGSKIMAFSLPEGNLIRTYPVPDALLHNDLNLNDVRINNTLGTDGFAFMTDNSKYGSIVAVDLSTGDMARWLFNTTPVMPDYKHVGSFDGAPFYAWNGTTKEYSSDGADGLALVSANVYWGPLSSRRFYYAPQSIMSNLSATQAEVAASVVFPGQLGSETAGFQADDKGRLYLLASEQNAIYYADTQQSQVTELVNGVPPGGSGPVPPDNYVVKSLIRNAEIQHADTAAILDGYLYFTTNQLELSSSFQYNNTDNTKGPFRAYRYFINAGPAV